MMAYGGGGASVGISPFVVYAKSGGHHHQSNNSNNQTALSYSEGCIGEGMLNCFKISI